MGSGKRLFVHRLLQEGGSVKRILRCPYCGCRNKVRFSSPSPKWFTCRSCKNKIIGIPFEPKHVEKIRWWGDVVWKGKG